MEQTPSRSVRCRPFPCPPTEYDKSTFMQLPLDLILHIPINFLDPVSALALSLTCKGMSWATFARSLPRLETSDLEGFLLLLEKDMCRQLTYYCHICTRLHTFNPAYESPPYKSGCHRILDADDCRSNGLCLNNVDLTISYPHARLIMNEHFYGARHGLPLSTLDITYRIGYNEPRWEQKWLARVIDDKLFLSARHTLRFEGTEGDFQGILDKREYHICTHVGIRKYAGRLKREYDKKMHKYRQGIRNLQNQSLQITGHATLPPWVWFNPPWSLSRTINSFRREDEDSASDMPRCQALRECRDVLGSCIFCATDYATTLEKKNAGGLRERGREELVLTIATYHELGSCRSPFDPKWEAFRRHVLHDYKPERETLGCLPGEVKRTWEEFV